ncbi:MAG: hypothetical protein ABIG67_03595 [Pseudomonadota bacterium]
MSLDFMKYSPLRILEKSSRKELGRGNLGVLMARAGVGKTACLIHIAFDKLLKKEKLVHVALEDMPEKVSSYYNVIFYDLVKALKIRNDNEIRMLMEGNRMILAYLSQSFEMERLRRNLKNLAEHIHFIPDTIIVDGLDFPKADRGIFHGFKQIANEFKVEVWFSALSHRHIPEVNDRGIPYPCHEIDELFSIILQLQPTQEGLFLNLLKDHENNGFLDLRVRLDPTTFLAID